MDEVAACKNCTASVEIDDERCYHCGTIIDKNQMTMNEKILNNWQFLNAKAEELKTITRACDPSERAVERAKEIAKEICETADLIQVGEEL